VQKDSNHTTTAGIIVIGNEILSGKVQDTNSQYLTTELRLLGVDVRRISVIPDEIEVIGREAKKFSDTYDHVFTCGGVGPTHDDVTMNGIASGFGVKIIVHPEIKQFLSAKYHHQLNDAVLKMAEVPEGAEIFITQDIRFPIVVFKNIFIFPGIPQYLKNKFSLIKERFRTSPFYVKRIYLDVHEAEIAGLLRIIVTENKDVSFGSYPVVGNPEYRVVVTAESKLSASLNKAVEAFLRRLPEQEHRLVRVE
jgi:molybdenum cofactor synthesis domain-containing protein